MIKSCTELYNFISASVTLIEFESHSGNRKMKLKVIFSLQVLPLFQLKLSMDVTYKHMAVNIILLTFVFDQGKYSMHFMPPHINKQTKINNNMILEVFAIAV